MAYVLRGPISHRTFHVKRRAAVAAGLLVVLMASGCATTSRDLVSGSKRGFGYSWTQQVQLGRESDPQIVGQFGSYTDAELSAYVDRIGQKLLAVSHLRRPTAPAEVQNTAFTFRVLDSPVVNAFALPGGYIYVTRGLLANLENEAQLAVVLGHEIGHVARQHAARQAFEAQRAQFGLLGAALLGQAVLGGNAAQAISQFGGQGLQLLLLKYGREDEMESDQLGVEYATLAGYKAEEGAEFFISLKRIGQKAGETLPEFLSTHPDPGNREVRIRQLAAEWDARTPGSSETVAEAEYDAQIDGITFGENPRQGFVENGTFYHPDLRFQFVIPQGFQLQNDAQQVVFGNGQGTVGALTLAQGTSAEASARTFASQQGVQVLDSGTDTINGLRAAYVAAEAQTQQGAVRTIQLFIEYGGRVYNLAALGAPAALAQYQNAYLATFRSFRPLTDARVLAVQPAKLDVITANRDGTLRDFVPSPLPRDITLEDIAIANQVTADARVTRGARFKTVAVGR